MRKNDYKDALNEIKLSQSFCEKMEKKLSEAAFDNDSYYDEVVHVDVVPKRTKRSFAVAAALVLALGIGGTGTALTLRNKITTELSDENIDNDENSMDNTDIIDEDNENNYEFEFPFGRIDLNKISCSYKYEYINCSTYAANNKLQKLITLFKSINWQTYNSHTKSNTTPVISNSKLIDPDSYADNGFEYAHDQDESETEHINFCTQDKKYNISFFCDGRVSVIKQEHSITKDENEPDSCYIYSYKIPVEKFNELKDIMFGNYYFGYIQCFGIKAALDDAYYKTDSNEGKLSTVQAFEIANMINSSANWSLIGENTYIPEHQKSISIRFREDDKVCNFEFIDSDNYLIINESSLKGEKIRTRLYQCDLDIYTCLKTLFNNGKECDFSPELGDTDHAYITVVKDGTVTGRQVSREKLDAMFHDNVNMKWYTIYDAPMPSDYDAAIFINTDNTILSFYEIKNKTYCFYYNDECYLFEGFDNLMKWALDLPETTEHSSEYVNKWLNDFLSNKEINILDLNNLKNDVYTSYTLKDTERLKQIFSEFDWECICSVKHLSYPSSLALSDEFFESIDNTTDENKTNHFSSPIFVINNGIDIISIQDNGVISSSYMGLAYKCSDPDKMLSAINELIKDSPKKSY